MVCHGEISALQVPLGCTPHKLAYLGRASASTLGSKVAPCVPTYAMLCSYREAWDPVAERAAVAAAEEAAAQAAAAASGAEVIPPAAQFPLVALPRDSPALTRDRYELRLVEGGASNVRWQRGVVDRFCFDANEVSLCTVTFYANHAHNLTRSP